MDKKVAVFVDVNNIYYCLNKKFESRKLDYESYLQTMSQFGQVYKAHAYGNQTKDEASKFIHRLTEIGFDTRFSDNSNKPVRRSNSNCAMTIDVVNIIDRVDTIVIGSSDPDLEPMVNWAKSKGVDAIVFSAGISQKLKKSCSKFVEISENLLEEIIPQKSIAE